MKKIIQGFTIAILAIMTVACGNSNKNNDGSSCDDSKLKEFVEQMKAELPLSVGNDIIFEKIKYDNHEVVMHYLVEDGLLDFDGIRANDGAVRDNMLLSFANNPDENFKKVIDAIIEAEASLKVVFSTKSRKDNYELQFTAEELKANRPGENADSEKLLKSMVDNTRLQTPLVIEDGIVMTDAFLDEHYFTYVYSCDESEIDIDALRENKILMKQSILEELNQDDGTLFQQIKNLLKKTGKGLAYKYVGSRSGKTFILRIEPNEL